MGGILSSIVFDGLDIAIFEIAPRNIISFGTIRICRQVEYWKLKVMHKIICKKIQDCNSFTISDLKRILSSPHFEQIAQIVVNSIPPEIMNEIINDINNYEDTMPELYVAIISAFVNAFPNFNNFEDIFAVVEHVCANYRMHKYSFETRATPGLCSPENSELNGVKATDVAKVVQPGTPVIDWDLELLLEERLAYLREHFPIFEQFFVTLLNTYEKMFRRFRLGMYFSITGEPDMIYLDDNPDEKRMKMYCSHVISANSMAQHVESVLKEGGYIIQCPGYGCLAMWPYFVVRYIIATFAYSCLEDDPRLEQLDRMITENSLGFRPCHKTCPSCNTWCYKDKASCICLECPICRFKFCWICSQQWTEDENNGSCCGNQGCNGVDRRIEILRNCQMVTIQGKECPSVRACPNCGVLTRYERNADPNHRCQQTKCKSCKYVFCFLCVKAPFEGRICHPSAQQCVVAEPQTQFPDKLVMRLADKIVRLVRPVNIRFPCGDNSEIVFESVIGTYDFNRIDNSAGTVIGTKRFLTNAPRN